MNIEESFLDAIGKSFSEYERFGARSNKKLIPIHSWLGGVLKKKLGNDYSIQCLGFGQEYKHNGKYYPKNLDITIFYKKKLVTTVSFKFVTSNYAQNSNNYFENLLGETANIRRSGIGFAHLIVLRGHTPYYDKNAGSKRGKVKRIEILQSHQIVKYIKLFRDQDFPHKPDVIGIVIIDFDKDGNASSLDLNNIFDEDTAKIINNEFGINRFINKTVSLIKFKS